MQKISKPFIHIMFSGLLLLLSVVLFASQAHAGTVTGSLQKWAPLTIDFNGPQASETDSNPNPFLDYRLNVTLTSPSGNTYLVPGFFAGDGQGGGQGSHWQIRFAADEVGQWQYSASMRSGSNVSIDTSSNAGNSVSLPDAQGQFNITQHSADAPGFLRYGRLEYTGEHYLKFRDGPYWLKSGTDSPENFLGYNGIDGTVDHGGSQFLHDFLAHRNDARDDDPVFSNASSGAGSQGITGALNYLSDQGVNSIYFLPMNLGGDGQDTFPFVGGARTAFNKTHYDISKLYQWNIVLNHAQRRGVALNIVLSETEVANERWLDNGELGTERKLYFRELIARFGHLLAAKWNLGEENDYPVSELREHASYISELDWTEKPIAVHTQINNFRDYEVLVGDELFSASSIQYDPPLADDFVETWRQRSEAAGRKWVIDMDENTGGVSNTNQSIRRKQILYDVYFSGGNLEWYFGLHPLPLGGDTNAGDFRTRENTWQTMFYARRFMETELPFWRMEPADNLVTGEANTHGGAEVFAAANEVYAVYLPQATGNPVINLNGTSGSFSQQWFNPRNGQFEGSTQNIVGGQRVSLGSPPSASNEDWVVLIRSHNAPALSDFTAQSAQSQAAAEDINTETDNQAADASNDSANAEQVDSDSTGSDSVDSDSTDSDSADSDSVDSDSVDSESADSESSNAESSNDDLSDNESTESSSQDDATSSDDNSESANDNSEDGSATVEPVAQNTPPEFSDLGELVVATQGETYTLTVIATDADGTAPVITADSLPLGMSITQVVDGVISIEWQVPVDAADSVEFELQAIDVANRNIVVRLPITLRIAETVTADDVSRDDVSRDDATSNDASSDDEIALADDATANLSSDAEFTTVTINDLAPTIFGAEDGQLIAGETYSRTIVPVDPEGIVAGLRAANLPGDSVFIDNGNGSREFIWTPNESDLGAHEIQFIATDSGTTPHVVQQSAVFTVIDADTVEAIATDDTATTNPNYEPLFFPLLSQQIAVGETLNVLIKPIDPNGTPPALHVMSPPTGASFIDNGDGTRTFSWTPTADFIGSLTVVFIATDTQDISVMVEESMEIEIVE